MQSILATATATRFNLLRKLAYAETDCIFVQRFS
jgi:hypothetical protein